MTVGNMAPENTLLYTVSMYYVYNVTKMPVLRKNTIFLSLTFSK